MKNILQKIITTITIIILVIPASAITSISKVIALENKNNNIKTILIEKQTQIIDGKIVTGVIITKTIKGIINDQNIFWKKINNKNYYSILEFNKIIPKNTTLQLLEITKKSVKKIKFKDKESTKKLTNNIQKINSFSKLLKKINKLISNSNFDLIPINPFDQTIDINGRVVPIITIGETPNPITDPRLSTITIENINDYTIDSNGNIVYIGGGRNPLDPADNGYNPITIGDITDYTIDSNGNIVYIGGARNPLDPADNGYNPITIGDVTDYTIDSNGNIVYIGGTRNPLDPADNGYNPITIGDVTDYTIDSNGNIVYIGGARNPLDPADNGYNPITIGDVTDYTIDSNGNIVYIGGARNPLDPADNGYNPITIGDVDDPQPDDILTPITISTINPTTRNTTTDRISIFDTNPSGPPSTINPPNTNTPPNTENPSETPSTAPSNPNNVVTKEELEICETIPNYNNLKITINYKKKKTYSNNKITYSSCPTATKQLNIIKDYNGCEIRHDFHTNQSYKQAKYYYYDSVGEKQTIKKCADTTTTYSHQKIVDNCKNFFNPATLEIYTRKKIYIENNGRIQLITDCQIITDQISILSTNDKQREILDEEYVDIQVNKAYEMYKEYYMINDKKVYTTNSLIDKNIIFPIEKIFNEECELNNNFNDNISYKQYILQYTNNKGIIKKVSSCLPDKTNPFTHEISSTNCQPNYINQRLFKKEQIIIRNNNQIIPVTQCTNTEIEIQLTNSKIKKNYDNCNIRIDQVNNKAIPQYQQTYPVGNRYEPITSCIDDTLNFYDLVLTTIGCNPDIDLITNNVTEKLRLKYYNGTENQYVGTCTIRPESKIYAIETSNLCPMKISQDKTQLIRQEKKKYTNSENIITNIGACQPTRFSISINPYLEQEYQNCPIGVTPNFEKALKGYRTFVNIPNGNRQIFSNCKLDQTSDGITIYKDYNACTPKIDTLGSNPKAVMRAKIYYIDNGNENIIQECATLENEIHNLTKNYNVCDPKTLIKNNRIFKYFQWEYTRNAIVYPINNKCYLESTSQHNLVEQFQCKDPAQANIPNINSLNLIVTTTTNDIEFYNNLDQGYSLILSKKVYQDQNGTWKIHENCQPRIEYGNFIHQYESCGWTHQDQNLRSIQNLQRKFNFPYKKIINKEENNNLLTVTLADTCGTTGNFVPVPYALILTKKYNKSDLRGEILTTNSVTYGEWGTVVFQGGHAYLPSLNDPPTPPAIAINKDGANNITTWGALITEINLSPETYPYQNRGCDRGLWGGTVNCRDNYYTGRISRKRYKKYYTGTTVIAHNIVEILKYRRSDNTYRYYFNDEYSTTTENLQRDLADDNIIYNSLIRLNN